MILNLTSTLAVVLALALNSFTDIGLFFRHLGHLGHLNTLTLGTFGQLGHSDGWRWRSRGTVSSAGPPADTCRGFFNSFALMKTLHSFATAKRVDLVDVKLERAQRCAFWCVHGVLCEPRQVQEQASWVRSAETCCRSSANSGATVHL